MANIFRVTTIGAMYGQQHQNVIHFTGPSSDPAQMSTLADEISASWITVIKARQTSSFVYSQIKVRLLESQFPPFVKTINIAGGNGSDTELATPLAFVVRLRTAFIGRKGRGRIYVGGVMKGWTTLGLVNADIITAWNNNFATLLGTFGPGGSSTFDLCVCNHSAPFDALPVTSMQIAPTLGVQRRRNIGIGV